MVVFKFPIFFFMCNYTNHQYLLIICCLFFVSSETNTVINTVIFIIPKAFYKLEYVRLNSI